MTLRFVMVWTIIAAGIAYAVGFFAGVAAVEKPKTFTYRRAAPNCCATSDGGSAMCFESGTVLESSDFPKGTFR